jgi:hypothetical protein
MKKGTAFTWGVILILLGVMFLVHNFSDIDIWDFVMTWWPLILIGLGIEKVVQHFRYTEKMR